MSSGSEPPPAWRALAAAGSAGTRLDRYLHQQLGIDKRAYGELAASGRLRLEDRAVLRGAPRLTAGAAVEIVERDRDPRLMAESIPLQIVFESQRLLALNKPSGMVVHPGPGHPAGTLVNALRGSGHALSSLEGPLRPGIVHRLDAGTSGLMLVAKDDATHRELTGLFQAHKVYKEYLALVHGAPPWRQREVEARLHRPSPRRKSYRIGEQGKLSKTIFTRLASDGSTSLLQAHPVTGRTHQIRVQLAHLGLPVVGDTLYGGGSRATARAARLGLRRLALHSWRLRSPELALHLTAELPEDLSEPLLRLGFWF